jgi:transcriptional regulator with XRE-family HTH domain
VGRTTDEWEARLGRQVRAERLRRGIDQASLARAANISTASLSALENGAGSRLGTLVKVVRALGRESWLDELAPAAEISPLALLRDKDRTTPRQRAPRQRAPRQRAPRAPGGSL